MLETGLQDRVCLVTGAVKGIGRACAEILGEQGARLVLCDIDAAVLVVERDLSRGGGATWPDSPPCGSARPQRYSSSEATTRPRS